MTKGWDEYFGMFPDYRIEVQTILQDGEVSGTNGTDIVLSS
jgi:hypothetical protein